MNYKSIHSRKPEPAKDQGGAILAIHINLRPAEETNPAKQPQTVYGPTANYKINPYLCVHSMANQQTVPHFKKHRTT